MLQPKLLSYATQQSVTWRDFSTLTENNTDWLKTQSNLWAEVYHPPTPKIKGTAVESVADTILSDSIPDEPPNVTGAVCVEDNNQARSR